MSSFYTHKIYFFKKLEKDGGETSINEAVDPQGSSSWLIYALDFR